MASPVKLSLEQRFAHQLRLDSDENIEEVATTSTPAVAVPPSRHLELAPHSFRIRNYLKENDVTFCHLDELKEKVLEPALHRHRAY